MTIPPLVSAIITFHRAPVEFFEEAIESVVAQTYREWELLLVDDGALPASVAVAKRYVARYPGKVRYLHHDGRTNRGMSASRQLGIVTSAGEYLAFLDSDDVWLPQKLKEQVEILAAHPDAAMAYGNTLYWSTWANPGDRSGGDFVPRLGVAPNRVVPPPSLLPLFLRGQAAVPCTCSILVRRASVDRIGGFESRFRHLYEDQVFYAKLCLEHPVYVSDRCWDKYRQHPTSATASAKAADEREARVEFLTWLEGYLVKRGRAEGSVWNAVRREIWIAGLHPHVRRLIKPLNRLTAILARARHQPA
jgi:glycosyltransferase involved in cell wall biosynthesis